MSTHRRAGLSLWLMAIFLVSFPTAQISAMGQMANDMCKGNYDWSCAFPNQCNPGSNKIGGKGKPCYDVTNDIKTMGACATENLCVAINVDPKAAEKTKETAEEAAKKVNAAPAQDPTSNNSDVYKPGDVLPPGAEVGDQKSQTTGTANSPGSGNTIRELQEAARANAPAPAPSLLEKISNWWNGTNQNQANPSGPSTGGSAQLSGETQTLTPPSSQSQQYPDPGLRNTQSSEYSNGNTFGAPSEQPATNANKGLLGKISDGIGGAWESAKGLFTSPVTPAPSPPAVTTQTNIPDKPLPQLTNELVENTFGKITEPTQKARFLPGAADITPGKTVGDFRADAPTPLDPSEAAARVNTLNAEAARLTQNSQGLEREQFHLADQQSMVEYYGDQLKRNIDTYSAGQKTMSEADRSAMQETIQDLQGKYESSAKSLTSAVDAYNKRATNFNEDISDFNNSLNDFKSRAIISPEMQFNQTQALVAQERARSVAEVAAQSNTTVEYGYGIAPGVKLLDYLGAGGGDYVPEIKSWAKAETLADAYKTLDQYNNAYQAELRDKSIALRDGTGCPTCTELNDAIQNRIKPMISQLQSGNITDPALKDYLVRRSNQNVASDEFRNRISSNLSHGTQDIFAAYSGVTADGTSLSTVQRISKGLSGALEMTINGIGHGVAFTSGGSDLSAFKNATLTGGVEQYKNVMAMELASTLVSPLVGRVPINPAKSFTETAFSVLSKPFTTAGRIAETGVVRDLANTAPSPASVAPLGLSERVEVLAKDAASGALKAPEAQAVAADLRVSAAQFKERAVAAEVAAKGVQINYAGNGVDPLPTSQASAQLNARADGLRSAATRYESAASHIDSGAYAEARNTLAQSPQGANVAQTPDPVSSRPVYEPMPQNVPANAAVNKSYQDLSRRLANASSPNDLRDIARETQALALETRQNFQTAVKKYGDAPAQIRAEDSNSTQLMQEAWRKLSQTQSTNISDSKLRSVFVAQGLQDLSKGVRNSINSLVSDTRKQFHAGMLAVQLVTTNPIGNTTRVLDDVVRPGAIVRELTTSPESSVARGVIQVEDSLARGAANLPEASSPPVAAVRPSNEIPAVKAGTAIPGEVNVTPSTVKPGEANSFERGAVPAAPKQNFFQNVVENTRTILDKAVKNFAIINPAIGGERAGDLANINPADSIDYSAKAYTNQGVRPPPEGAVYARNPWKVIADASSAYEKYLGLPEGYMKYSESASFEIECAGLQNCANTNYVQEKKYEGSFQLSKDEFKSYLDKAKKDIQEMKSAGAISDEALSEFTNAVTEGEKMSASGIDGRYNHVLNAWAAIAYHASLESEIRAIYPNDIAKQSAVKEALQIFPSPTKEFLKTGKDVSLVGKLTPTQLKNNGLVGAESVEKALDRFVNGGGGTGFARKIALGVEKMQTLGEVSAQDSKEVVAALGKMDSKEVQMASVPASSQEQLASDEAQKLQRIYDQLTERGYKVIPIEVDHQLYRVSQEGETDPSNYWAMVTHFGEATDSNGKPFSAQHLIELVLQKDDRGAVTANFGYNMVVDNFDCIGDKCTIAMLVPKMSEAGKPLTGPIRTNHVALTKARIPDPNGVWDNVHSSDSFALGTNAADAVSLTPAGIATAKAAGEIVLKEFGIKPENVYAHATIASKSEGEGVILANALRGDAVNVAQNDAVQIAENVPPPEQRPADLINPRLVRTAIPYFKLDHTPTAQEARELANRIVSEARSSRPEISPAELAALIAYNGLNMSETFKAFQTSVARDFLSKGDTVIGEVELRQANKEIAKLVQDLVYVQSDINPNTAPGTVPTKIISYSYLDFDGEQKVAYDTLARFYTNAAVRTDSSTYKVGQLAAYKNPHNFLYKDIEALLNATSLPNDTIMDNYPELVGRPLSLTDLVIGGLSRDAMLAQATFGHSLESEGYKPEILAAFRALEDLREPATGRVTAKSPKSSRHFGSCWGCATAVDWGAHGAGYDSTKGADVASNTLWDRFDGKGKQFALRDHFIADDPAHVQLNPGATKVIKELSEQVASLDEENKKAAAAELAALKGESQLASNFDELPTLSPSITVAELSNIDTGDFAGVSHSWQPLVASAAPEPTKVAFSEKTLAQLLQHQDLERVASLGNQISTNAQADAKFVFDSRQFAPSTFDSVTPDKAPVTDTVEPIFDRDKFNPPSTVQEVPLPERKPVTQNDIVQAQTVLQKAQNQLATAKADHSKVKTQANDVRQAFQSAQSAEQAARQAQDLNDKRVTVALTSASQLANKIEVLSKNSALPSEQSKEVLQAANNIRTGVSALRTFANQVNDMDFGTKVSNATSLYAKGDTLVGRVRSAASDAAEIAAKAQKVADRNIAELEKSVAEETKNVAQLKSAITEQKLADLQRQIQQQQDVVSSIDPEEVQVARKNDVVEIDSEGLELATQKLSKLEQELQESLELSEADKQELKEASDRLAEIQSKIQLDQIYASDEAAQAERGLLGSVVAKISNGMSVLSLPDRLPLPEIDPNSPLYLYFARFSRYSPEVAPGEVNLSGEDLSKVNEQSPNTDAVSKVTDTDSGSELSVGQVKNVANKDVPALLDIKKVNGFEKDGEVPPGFGTAGTVQPQNEASGSSRLRSVINKLLAPLGLVLGGGIAMEALNDLGGKSPEQKNTFVPKTTNDAATQTTNSNVVKTVPVGSDGAIPGSSDGGKSAVAQVPATDNDSTASINVDGSTRKTSSGTSGNDLSGDTGSKTVTDNTSSSDTPKKDASVSVDSGAQNPGVVPGSGGELPGPSDSVAGNTPGSSGKSVFGSLGQLFSNAMKSLGSLFGQNKDSDSSGSNTNTTAHAEIFATPEVVKVGERTSLRWSSEGTDGCVVYIQDKSVFLRGYSKGATTSPELSEDTKFTLSCTNVATTADVEDTVFVRVSDTP